MPNEYWLADANVHCLGYIWILHGKMIGLKVLDFSSALRMFQSFKPILKVWIKKSQGSLQKCNGAFMSKLASRSQVHQYDFCFRIQRVKHTRLQPVASSSSETSSLVAGPTGVAHRFGHQPHGQLHLRPGQQRGASDHREPTGDVTKKLLYLDFVFSCGSTFSCVFVL